MMEYPKQKWNRIIIKQKRLESSKLTRTAVLVYSKISCKDVDFSDS